MDFQESKAIYLQIADKIMDDIMAGTYEAESRLPSVREYAAMVEVNANTVMRTYDFLAQRGLIYNRRGIGFFVEGEARNRITDMRRTTFYATEMPFFMERLTTFCVSPDELKELYINYLASKQTNK